MGSKRQTTMAKLTRERKVKEKRELKEEKKAAAAAAKVPPSAFATHPMTYLFEGKQFIVVAIGGVEQGAEYVALSLP